MDNNVDSGEKVFAVRIKHLLAERNEAQKDFAKEIEVSPSNVTHFLNGREPSYDILIKIANHFDVTTDYLLGLENVRKHEENNLLKNIQDVCKSRGADWLDYNVIDTQFIHLIDELVLKVYLSLYYLFSVKIMSPRFEKIVNDFHKDLKYEKSIPSSILSDDHWRLAIYYFLQNAFEISYCYTEIAAKDFNPMFDEKYIKNFFTGPRYLYMFNEKFWEEYLWECIKTRGLNVNLDTDRIKTLLNEISLMR